MLDCMKGYGYLINNGECWCLKDWWNVQHRAQFAEVKRKSTFHDETLADYSKKINSLLAEAVAKKKDNNMELAILITPKGPFLAWSKYGPVGPDSDDEEINEALGLA